MSIRPIRVPLVARSAEEYRNPFSDEERPTQVSAEFSAKLPAVISAESCDHRHSGEA
jgi:hypothetical protein